MKKILSIALLSAIALCSQAQASDNLNYSYVEAGYVNLDGDASGWGLRGSVNFGESNFYGFGSYSNIESSILENTYLGIGYHHGVSDSTDMIAQLAYVNADLLGFDVDGYEISIGFRNAFSDNVEGLLKANYTDGSDFDGDFSVNAGLVFNVNENIGVVGEINFADGGNTYMLGLRGNF